MTSRDLFELEHGDTGVALLAHVHAFDFFSRTLEACDHMHYYCECGASEPCWDEAKVKAEVAHSDRDGSESGSRSETWAPRTDIPGGNVPARGAETMLPDERTKRLTSLSRWERAGMLAYVAATFPDAFDEAFKALGLAEP